jgi:hypothetical protein
MAFLGVLLNDRRAVTAKPSTTSRADYEAKVLGGGLPIAVARAGGARRCWFADHVRTCRFGNAGDQERVK